MSGGYVMGFCEPICTCPPLGVRADEPTEIDPTPIKVGWNRTAPGVTVRVTVRTCSWVTSHRARMATVSHMLAWLLKRISNTVSATRCDRYACLAGVLTLAQRAPIEAT